MAAKTLEEKVQRIQDFQEIQNIMGRYAYITMAASEEERRYTLFAEKAPDVRVTHLSSFIQEGIHRQR